MARQIAYDPMKMKQDVMSLFWARGYAETSLADIEDATGLNRRQLYNGIGDKRSMFLSALDNFTDLSGRSLLAPLEAETAGVADIDALFGIFVEMSQDGTGDKGCMVCSSSQEEIAKDPDVATRINAFFERIRAAHLNALTRASAREEIPLKEPDIQSKADALLAAHVALCILGKAGRSKSQLENIAEHATRGL